MWESRGNTLEISRGKNAGSKYPGGKNRWKQPGGAGSPAMACFPQLWRSSTPSSPDSPGPGSPAEPPVPVSPLVLPSPSRKGRSPLGSPCSPKPASPVECSICFTSYDNSFKTPKLLRCQHVFCLECVARLSTALPPGQAEELLPCPFCRQLTPIPQQGAPGLATSKELLATLPPEQQRERLLWMDGTKLCCRRGSGDAESAEACDSIDVALSKAESAEAAAPGLQGRFSRCDICEDWKRLVLLSALLIILLCIVLWPVQCALRTGSLRCLARPAAVSRPQYLPAKGSTVGPALTQPPLP